jgi:hypothetical protein
MGTSAHTQSSCGMLMCGSHCGYYFWILFGAHERAMWEPLKTHAGATLGAITDPCWGPFWRSLWYHVGIHVGAHVGPTRCTISDAFRSDFGNHDGAMREPILYHIVGPFLDPCWYPYMDHLWGHSRDTFRSDVGIHNGAMLEPFLDPINNFINVHVHGELPVESARAHMPACERAAPTVAKAPGELFRIAKLTPTVKLALRLARNTTRARARRRAYIDKPTPPNPRNIITRN